jgi:hypothetical protein
MNCPVTIKRGQSFNSIGILEISQIALEELLQNALIHRDYCKNTATGLTELSRSSVTVRVEENLYPFDAPFDKFAQGFAFQQSVGQER